ncbi:MAG: hypothetical protein DMF70_10290 [Acidobacteria bacterium]|nr:MAG: hypothetical protein DMF70_10290 [Acidobacteriota bacterium]
MWHGILRVIHGRDARATFHTEPVLEPIIFDFGWRLVLTCAQIAGTDTFRVLSNAFGCPA